MTTEQALVGAINEIKSLRHHCELLTAKVNTFESCVLLLNTQPNHPNICLSQDIVYHLEKVRDEVIDNAKPKCDPRTPSKEIDKPKPLYPNEF